MLYHWGTIFNGSLTFHKQDINFIMNYFSKKRSDSEQLFLHPEQQQSGLIFIIKHLASLNSGLLCYQAKHSLWSCYLSLNIILWQIGLRDWHKNKDAAIGMSNK